MKVGGDFFEAQMHGIVLLGSTSHPENIVHPFGSESALSIEYVALTEVVRMFCCL